MKSEIYESDFSTEEMIELKNIIMMAIRDSKHGNRFKNDNLNLVETLKYGLVASLLAVPCSHEERLEILLSLYEASKHMIIDYDSRRGLE